MKISRKMKKFFASFLTITLSIIMFVTQTSALNTVSNRAYFEREGIFDAYETMTWDPNGNRLDVAIDVECYECATVDYVKVSLAANVKYYELETDTWYVASADRSDTQDLTYLDTWDSDEVCISVIDFDRGNEYEKIKIEALITYKIFYVNGDTETYKYKHTASLLNGDSFDWERTLSN